MKTLRAMQERDVQNGLLRVQVISEETSRPIEGARIQIGYTGVPDSNLTQLATDSSGNAAAAHLEAPPAAYSLSPDTEEQPYSQYTLTVSAPGYETLTVAGAQLLPGVAALQTVTLRLLQPGQEPEVYVIPAHTLYGNYPPKLPEAEIKPLNETGEIVLSRVVVPEYIVVHDGSPRDNTAKNYYVRYRDYIRNVASSEIYATWPEEALRANVLAIMSFTLNRVYTEWYRNQGYDFTITSSTAYDHKWIPGRNYYDTISSIVDEQFSSYLSRPNVRQPILTQYCDGQHVQCPNWMSQWGSKALAEEGYSAVEILRYYYGNDLYINQAEEISGVPSSWPGYTLASGSAGEKVLQLQEELNGIADAYPRIPRLAVDGIYGPKTAQAVQVFQSIFGLPESGTVDYRTWYRISEIYVAVSRIAELTR